MITARSASFRLRILCVAMAAVFPALADAAVAGRVQFVAGDVRAVDEKGKERPLRKGEDINEGDTIRSAPGASAQLKMIDGGIVAVRPDTQLKVIDYVFNGQEDGSESANFSLVKGGLRAITGLVGRVDKSKYKIQTPTAVIGIRGTDHEPVVVLPAATGELAGNPAGTYDKVNVGAVALTNQAGTAVVAPNQVGFAASLTQAPVILPKMPDFYRATPAPLAKQEQAQEKKEQAQGSAQQGSEQTAGSTSSDAVAEQAVTTVAAAPANLTATDASGNTLNLSNQTLTTASGESVTLNNTTSGNLTRPAIPHSEVLATYPIQIQGGTGGPSSIPLAVPGVFFFGGPTQALAYDAAGNLSGVSASDATIHSEGYRSTLSQSGSALTDLGTVAATGLAWGRWQGGQVTQTSQYLGVDASGNFGLGGTNASDVFVIGGAETTTAALGSGSLHWIAGNGASPSYLPRVLTGSANYTLAGGTRPTDQLGNTGTLTSATLGVNFTTQTANASIDFSIGGNAWNMKSGAMELDGSFFSSYSSCDTTCTSNVSLTKNGAALAQAGTSTTGFGFGSMNGALMGTGLNSAGLQYSVHEAVAGSSVDSTTGTTFTTFTNNLIQGVAGFTGPTQDVNTPFRIVGVVDGWDHSMDSLSLEDGAGGFFRGSIDSEESTVASVVDGPGGLTQFVGEVEGYTPLNGSTSDTSERHTLATINVGTAVNRDVGSATIGGMTVSWGRWEGGSVDIYSRDGSVKLGTIDNSERSIHWIASPILTGTSTFGSMPLTGSATYTLAGHTNPTDFKGNVGTLNSATLSADFSNARVNAGVSVSFNSPTNTSNWNMSASNIPMSRGNEFESSSLLNGVNGVSHSASCTGASCGAQTIGKIDGLFFGGAQGAVMVYGMATGSVNTATTNSSAAFTPANAVTGLAVMKR